jgi:hypothetical protein
LKAAFADPGMPGYSSGYSGVTVDGGGNIYALGTRFADDDSHSRLFLHGLSPDAVSQWNTELASPTHVHVSSASIVLTSDGSLLATVRQYDDPKDWTAAGPLGLAAFATDGAELWWKEWAPPEPWHPLGGLLVPSADGGAYLAGSLADGQERAIVAARLAVDGQPVWTNLGVGAPVRDALLGPDGLFYVLTQNAIVPFLP